ncbi:MAG TPA: hypothetical protein VFC14_14315 [Burkholderiales bacterium]|nr:hypothetical protein [Burkholderiales bacterium]
MSQHRTAFVGDLEYAFAPNDPDLLARRIWALATARAVDEITDDALRVPIRVRVEQTGVLVKTGDDATFALVARPWQRFPPLFGAAPRIDITVEADSYLTCVHRFTLNYAQRHIAVPAPAPGATALTLDNANNLVAGQALLIGPVAGQEYVRIANLGPGANQVTLAAGLSNPHNVGDPVFPDGFDPGPTTVLRMHRRPVTIRGRVVRRDTATGLSTPAAGATITVTDFWRTQNAVRTHQPGAMTDPNPAQRSFALSISPGAFAARAAGAAAGNAAALAPVPNEDKFLRRDAEAGADRIELTDRVNIALNELLRIDADDASVAEYQTIAAIASTGGPIEPAVATLDLPLRNAHPRDARVERFGPPGAPTTPCILRDDVLPGDACLFFDSLALLPAQGGLLRLNAGGTVDEYQSFNQLAATADAEGYFRLPAIHRVAQLQIAVVDGANNRTIDFQPNYSERESWLEVAFAI